MLAKDHPRVEDFLRQTGDVRWDAVSRQELGHFIAEGVAVVVKQVVLVWSVITGAHTNTVISSGNPFNT